MSLLLLKRMKVKRIALLSTGGTIAMQAEESGLANSALGPEKLLELADGIEKTLPLLKSVIKMCLADVGCSTEYHRRNFGSIRSRCCKNGRLGTSMTK